MRAMMMADDKTRTHGAPPDKPEWTKRQLYEAERVMSILVGWPRFMLTQRGPVKPFSEGGSIQRREIRSEAAFCAPVADYVALDSEVARLDHEPQTIVRLRWQVGLTQQAICDYLGGRDRDIVRTILWGATAQILYELAELPDAYSWLRIWRERAHQQKTDFA